MNTTKETENVHQVRKLLKLTPQSHDPSWCHCQYEYYNEDPQYFRKQHVKHSYKPLVCIQMLL